MGIPVLILGESGSGKSTSLRNFKPDELGLINVSKKPLPFKTDIKPYNSDNYIKIEAAIKKSKVKSFAIDDAQYLMANEYMRNAKVNGYQKFTDIALNFWTLIKTVIDDLSDDKIVYFLGHIERDQNGNEKFKTIGKMLDEKITLEGMFTITLKTVVKDGRYGFTTQTNGQDPVKSPLGMFDEPVIDNDLKYVDDVIRNYYNLNDKGAENDD